jgi:tight adherence protein C
MVQAGFYRRSAVVLYFIVRVGMMLGPLALGIVVANLGLVTMRTGLMYGALAGVFGTVAPSFWLDYMKAKRQLRLRRALPDALDVIIVCVEAGLSLPAALTRVAKELSTAHPMLAAELAICQREVQMGYSSGEALRSFSERFDLEELRSLASVVQQAERFGASIANALRVHADSLREKRFQRAEEMAQKAVVKLVFPTVFCIFPALFVVLVGPALFRIFEMFDRLAAGR